MTDKEALNLIRELLRAPNEEDLMRLVSQNLSRFDSTFFATRRRSVEQLNHEGKPEIAQALERLGGIILRMRTLI